MAWKNFRIYGQRTHCDGAGSEYWKTNELETVERNGNSSYEIIRIKCKRTAVTEKSKRKLNKRIRKKDASPLKCQL